MLLVNMIIIALLVTAIWYTMLEGEIFGFIGKWLSNLPDKLQQPVFACNVCMCPWHGTWIYLVLWGWSWMLIPTVIGAMGINYYLNQLHRDE